MILYQIAWKLNHLEPDQLAQYNLVPDKNDTRSRDEQNEHWHTQLNPNPNQPTDRRTDKASYRVACPQLKICPRFSISGMRQTSSPWFVLLKQAQCLIKPIHMIYQLYPLRGSHNQAKKAAQKVFSGFVQSNDFSMLPYETLRVVWGS